MKIPESHLDLLADEKKSFAFLATLMADGSPQVTPVWFQWDGQDFTINTARGRIKDRNMLQRPQVAIAISDPENPYRYLQLRGRIVEDPTRDGRAHINFLSNKYTGNPIYSGDPSEDRVAFRLEISKVTTMG